MKDTINNREKFLGKPCLFYGDPVNDVHNFQTAHRKGSWNPVSLHLKCAEKIRGQGESEGEAEQTKQAIRGLPTMTRFKDKGEI